MNLQLAGALVIADASTGRREVNKLNDHRVVRHLRGLALRHADLHDRLLFGPFAGERRAEGGFDHAHDDAAKRQSTFPRRRQSHIRTVRHGSNRHGSGRVERDGKRPPIALGTHQRHYLVEQQTRRRFGGCALYVATTVAGTGQDSYGDAS